MPAARALPTALTTDTLPEVLALLRRAVSRPRPEQALAELVFRLTGGSAELRASWGDVLAQAGPVQEPVQEQGDPVSFRLAHQGRQVGRLQLQVPPHWQGLEPLVAEYALLARLQSAAAGAARRRVGERTLDALLEGREQTQGALTGPFAVAAATYAQPPARGAGARAAHAHALDVLAGVGEGYFAERHLRGLCTVRGDRAVWLWPTQHPEPEAQGLLAALSESTGQAVRLGVSAVHQPSSGSGPFSGPAALAEAEQALQGLQAAGIAHFTALDAFQRLLSGSQLDQLRAQLRSQLAPIDQDGKIEATLRAFLTHSGTLEGLARQQHIHVNTLRYRLRLAERAVEGSLSDPGTRTRLYLSLTPS